MLRIGLVALFAIVAAGPASARGEDGDYSGADAGYLVYSVGTVKIGMHFDFHYRPTSTAAGLNTKDWSGRIRPKLGGAIYLKVKNPDFTGEESGHVVVRRMPPGRYEVHKFSFTGSTPTGGSVHWSPARPFTLPFEVRAGEATYIGSFMRAPSLGTPLQPVLGAAGYFIVADRSARDVPIAGGRLPPATRLTPEVTDVSQFGSQALRTGQP